MVNNKVLAIILGGGQGTRLHPLTEDRSKPAVPIAGKYRLVDIPISNCINSDVKRMYVLTQFNSASLNKHIKNTYHFSFFSSAFVDVLAAEQTPHNKTWFQGTADAVRQSMHHFLRHDFDYALILSGDQLYQMDYNEMIQAHEESNADISIATIPVNAKDATGFGILKSNEENVITSFIEKPSTDKLPGWESEVSDDMAQEGRHYLASMGIYLFNRELLKKLLSDTDAVDFGKEIIPNNINTYKTLSYQFEGYWTDIGTIDAFFDANIGLTKNIPEFDLYSLDHRIYTRARILPTTKIGNTLLTNTVLAEGCIINAKSIEHSVIGIRSRIDEGTVLKSTYMMGCDTYQTWDEIIQSDQTPIGIGKNCHISHAILDKNCRIGDNVTIKGGAHLEDTETESYSIRDGVVVVKKSAVIPNGFVIG